MMEKYFATYNQSLALKELGFDEPCIAFYSNRVLTFHTHGIDPHFIFKKNSDLWDSCSAPLKQQVFEWFRDKHNLYHSINPLGYNMCLALIGELGSLKSCNVPEYGNYEEAESACIDKLIELLQHDK